jgi:glutathione S-transferase
MMTLFSYSISPYAAKVRAILQYKGLPFEERFVHPLDRREIVRLSGQKLVPVLVDDGRVVADSTRIARYLDERYPSPPILPADPALRARALLLEEWADEALPRAVQPVRWFLPQNRQRTEAKLRAPYPSTLVEDVKWTAIFAVMRYDMWHRYARERIGLPRPAAVLNRLAEVLDVLDGALAETGWLAGPAPTVADFAAWGFLCWLEELDGWETVKVRRRVVKLVRALGQPRASAPEAYDAEDAAQLEASRHRREARRLPVV